MNTRAGSVTADLHLAVFLFVPWAVGLQLVPLLPDFWGAIWMSVVAIGFYMVHLRRREADSTLDLRSVIPLALPSRRDYGPIALGSAAGLLMMVGVALISARGADQLPIFPFGHPQDLSVPSLIILIAVVAVAGPVLEEFFFRGWILTVLCLRVHWAPSVFVSASMFGAAHIFWYSQPLFLLVPFALGLICGGLVARTKSIWSAVAVHSMWNSCVLCLAIAADESILRVTKTPGAMKAGSLLVFLGAVGTWLAKPATDN